MQDLCLLVALWSGIRYSGETLLAGIVVKYGGRHHTDVGSLEVIVVATAEKEQQETNRADEICQ